MRRIRAAAFNTSFFHGINIFLQRNVTFYQRYGTARVDVKLGRWLNWSVNNFCARVTILEETIDIDNTKSFRKLVDSILLEAIDGFVSVLLFFASTVSIPTHEALRYMHFWFYGISFGKRNYLILKYISGFYAHKCQMRWLTLNSRLLLLSFSKIVNGYLHKNVFGDYSYLRLQLLRSKVCILCLLQFWPNQSTNDAQLAAALLNSRLLSPARSRIRSIRAHNLLKNPLRH